MPRRPYFPRLFRLVAAFVLVAPSFASADDLAETLRKAAAAALKARYPDYKPPPDPELVKLDAAIRRKPSSDAYLRRGQYWWLKNELDKSIADFDAALKLEPDYGFVYRCRGLVKLTAERYDQAIADFTAAIPLRPNDCYLHYKRGVAWREKGNVDQALADFDAAIRMDPANMVYLNDRGNIWRIKKDFNRSIKDFDASIKLSPTYALPYNNRGNSWADKKEFDRALADYAAAIRLDPTYAAPLYNRADLLRQKEDYDRSLADTAAALKLDPKLIQAHFLRGVLLLQTRRPGAAAGFQQVIDLGGYRGERAAHAVLLAYQSARLAGDVVAAQRILTDSAGKLDKDVWPAPVVYFLRGDLSESRLLSLATGDISRQTLARCHLGIHHALAGDTSKAGVHFTWVRENGDPSLYEHPLALAEQKRMAKPAVSAKP